ncbi:MAG: thioesterase domain-containing protein, partial [Acidobacteriota bacterium]
PGSYARRLLVRQQGLQDFEGWSLATLFAAGGVTLRRAPFDSMVTYANFPAPGSAEEKPESAGEPRLESYRGDLTSAFPCTLAVLPTEGDALSFELAAHASRVPNAEALLDRFLALLESLVEEDSESIDAWRQSAPRPLAQTAARERAPAAAPRALGGTGAEAPATATEAQLMRLWNDLITVQEYGADDNFFDLGGHSLLVPQMLQRIETDFGVEMPLGAVFENASIRALAARIDEAHDLGGAREQGEGARAWRPLVAIRPEGSGGPPLFMVHGLGGEVGWFYNLANYLRADLPLFGLQAPPEPLEDLEAMASLYLEEVRRAQPAGLPYRLGGYCVGGGVAYEMARQLEEAGERCELLVLIDSVPHAHIAGQEASPARGLKDRLGHLLAKEPKEIVRSTQDFARRAGRRLKERLPGADDGPLELDHVLDMDTLPRVYHRASRSHFRAMRDYLPGPYGGRILLLRTRDERFGEDFGWGEVAAEASEIAVERVPGKHVDVLKEPYVAVVGGKISAALEDPGP